MPAPSVSLSVGRSHRRAVEPLHFGAPVVLAFLVVVIGRSPIQDPDIWWHRELGFEIVATRAVSGIGNTWAPFGDQAWVTTQWLSEVLVFALHSLAGWQSVVVLRVLVSAATLVALAATVLPGRPARAAVPVLALAAIGLTPGLTQDRPQSFGLLLAVPLGLWIARGLAARVPPWWQVVLLSALWANLHGSWVLVPAVFALLTVASLVDPGLRSTWRQFATRAALSLLAGLLNPAFWHSLVAIVRFRGQTSHITEWQPTLLLDTVALPFTILIVLVVLAWARQREIPVAEIVVVIGLVGFALLAFRNVLFAYILLAPLIAQRLSHHVKTRPSGHVEARSLIAVGTVLAAAGLLTALAFAARSDPLRQVEPLAIATTLAEVDGPKRILNDYNVAGVLVAFGGEGIELAIDGRADRYSPEYVDRHLGALSQLIDWEEVLTDVEPDYAVLATDQALPVHLSSLGWRTMLTDGRYVLLMPPA